MSPELFDLYFGLAHTCMIRSALEAAVPRQTLSFSHFYQIWPLALGDRKERNKAGLT
jgi:hypothetical protein